jgi:hypothetical protein
MTENISFVVQGPISHESIPAENAFSTREVLMSIRKHYPYSEIILSTWKGSDISDLSYDKIVLNEDPGAFVVDGIKRPFNHNRLVISTSSGISVATKDFVVKTRTDILFESDNILNILPLITPIEGPYAIFNSYILSTNYYVRNPMRVNLYFHPSDIILVGKIEDMKFFFSAPMAERHKLVTENEEILMVAEQYLLLNSIEHAQDKRYSSGRIDYTNIKHFMDSEKYLFSSFNILSIADFGVKFPDRLLFAHLPDGNYSLDEIKVLTNLYRKSEDIDGYSYLRAAKYLGRRTGLYMKAKTSSFLNKVYSNNDADN